MKKPAPKYDPKLMRLKKQLAGSAQRKPAKVTLAKSAADGD
jgi:hypothetical protein